MFKCKIISNSRKDSTFGNPSTTFRKNSGVNIKFVICVCNIAITDTENPK